MVYVIVWDCEVRWWQAFASGMCDFQERGGIVRDQEVVVI